MKILTEQESLENFFKYFVHLYDSEKKPQFSCVYQFILKDSVGINNYFVEISEGVARYKKGKHAAPNLSLFSTIENFFDIASAKLNPVIAFLFRKVRIAGSIYYFYQLGRIFNRDFVIAANQETVTKKPSFFRKKWDPPKKTLIINCSQRQEDGCTYFYLKNLIKGIKKTSTKISILNLYDEKINIRSCRACFMCWEKTNGKCVINDDANYVWSLIRDADLVIFAMPLLSDSMPSKLKIFFERNMMNFNPSFLQREGLTRHAIRNYKQQYYALFCISGFPEKKHFVPLIDTIKAYARNNNVPVVASIIRPGAFSLIKAPLYHFYLKDVLHGLEDAGKYLIEKGRIPKKILNLISSNYNVSMEKWRKYSNLYYEIKKAKKGEEKRNINIEDVSFKINIQKKEVRS
jgi:multimeric flavodoxin WrbA